MLTDLEVYLYSDRYGPTNEKLGVYLKELFGVRDPGAPHSASRSLN
jgi:serine/threonine-protein kinase